MKKVWNVAIYARVSTDKKDQSESIPAQIEGLKKWLFEKSDKDKAYKYNLEEVYKDQGFSGSSFNRESFIKMKEDIERGRINMILTRDLSRFARNYIIAGYYLEDYFKKKGVRFISVLDNVDTIYEVDDIVPFKNILNEMYIKDCSRRTREGLKQRMLRGSSIASKPLYGYKFEETYNSNIKNIRLVPRNDETTKVVRKIFSLYIKGFGMERIANYLNNKRIEPPSVMYRNLSKGKFKLWNGSTIRYILTNPKYAGIMVQGRWKKVSYKIKKVIYNSKEEWIIGGQFKGIVSKEDFNIVQNLIKKRRKNFRQKSGNIHLFSGILKCNECGGSMSYRGNFKGYKCTNSQRGGGRCTAHSIKEEYLKEIIKKNLKKYVNTAVNKSEFYNLAKEKIKYKNNYEKDLKNIKKQLERADRQFKQIYIDKFNEVISERNFQNLISSVEKKQQFLIEKKQRIEELEANISDKYKLYNDYKNKIDKVLDFENLDRFTIESLIDKIIIFEDKDSKKKSIDIYYKFK